MNIAYIVVIFRVSWERHMPGHQLGWTYSREREDSVTNLIFRFAMLLHYQVIDSLVSKRNNESSHLSLKERVSKAGRGNEILHDLPFLPLLSFPSFSSPIAKCSSSARYLCAIVYLLPMACF